MNENGTVMPVVPYGSNNDGMFGYPFPQNSGRYYGPRY